jgi:hypothetical protein
VIFVGFVSEHILGKQKSDQIFNYLLLKVLEIVPVISPTPTSFYSHVFLHKSDKKVAVVNLFINQLGLK